MKNRDIVLEYLRCFCAGDIDGLERLLAPELRFNGPLHSFDTARQYIDSLRADPPEKSRYDIVSITESDDSIAVFYEYHKPDYGMTIAQLFRISDRKISEILLVFDGRDIG